ncbi:MAG: hypothetical protein DDT32_01044 [Syntrophomonadaceae bacterium]|nr:hypothetical protein [Bacillota bacterium]
MLAHGSSDRLMIDATVFDVSQCVGNIRRLFYQVYRLHHALTQGKQVLLDISKVEFWYPKDVINLSLACTFLSRTASRRGGQFRINPPETTSESARYLERMNFCRIFADLLPREYDDSIESRYGRDLDPNSLLELRIVTSLPDPLAMHAEVESRVARILHVRDPKLTPIKQFAAAVYELCENIAFHSTVCSRLTGSEHGILGFAIMQRYAAKHRTYLAVGDLGDGILKTLRLAYPLLKDDVEAISLAVQPRVSRSKDSDGLGLPRVLRIVVESWGGEVEIDSAGGWMLFARNKSIQRQSRLQIPGTRVYVSLPI